MAEASAVLTDSISTAVIGPTHGVVATDLGLSYEEVPTASAPAFDTIPKRQVVLPYIKDQTTGRGRLYTDIDALGVVEIARPAAGAVDLYTDDNTTTISVGGGATQSTITIGKTGVGNKVNGYLNIQGATSATADGDLAVGDGSNELFYDASAGQLVSSGAFGQGWNIQQATTELTGLTGATATAASLIPAGSLVVGVTTRVTTAITGATSYDIGDGSDPIRWGTLIGVTLGTTSDPTDFTDNTLQWQTAAAGDVVLTANGSNFTAGAVRITVAYISLIAPTS